MRRAVLHHYASTAPVVSSLIRWHLFLGEKRSAPIGYQIELNPLCKVGNVAMLLEAGDSAQGASMAHDFHELVNEVQRAARAVPPQSLQFRGRYTSPRTWGVYRCGSAFHSGNHPVRQKELGREFRAVELLLLFSTKTEANEVKRLLNGRH